MDELIHYYSVDVAVTFDIDLDSDQIDTELTSDIYDTFVEELQEAFNNNSEVDLDDYDWSWDKDHDYIQHLYISSKLDKAAVTPIVENILDSIVSFERTDELWDGTYSIETHGLDTPPYEHIERTRDYTYTVEVECEVIRFFETTEDGEVLVEKVTKNELKDRAKKHAKKQRGITTLNPDAGNVEYNIGMFNKMGGAVEGPSNNPVSGPFGGDVSVACCEDVSSDEHPNLFNRHETTDTDISLRKQLSKEERMLVRQLSPEVRGSNYVIKKSLDKYDVYEDGELLESGFDSMKDLDKYLVWYNRLLSTRLARYNAEDEKKIRYAENTTDVIDLLKDLCTYDGVDLLGCRSTHLVDDRIVDFVVFKFDSSSALNFVASKLFLLEYAPSDARYFTKNTKISTPPKPRYTQLSHCKTVGDYIDTLNYKIITSGAGYNGPRGSGTVQDALKNGHAFRREIADYAQSNDDADYRAGVYENLDDIEKNEKVFMEEYDFTNIDTTYTKEVGLNDYFESMNNEDDLSETEQEFSSAATSINGSKLPAIFKLVDFHTNTLNLDYGGGKFDTATEYLKTLGVTNLIYDKFNRTAQHNQEVIRAVRENGGADTCTLSNVLNVIKEESIRHEILVNIHKLLKSNGILYITVFEGKPGQKEGPTKSGYQLARKTSEYIDEVANVFGEDNVTRRGKLIVARKQVTF